MKSFWFNKKHGATKFISYYERDKRGERVFVLIATKAPFRRVTFESHQSAKKNGYVKDQDRHK